MPAFVIFSGCDNGAAYADIDAIVDTLSIAKREKKDLTAMGCGPVRIYEFADWTTAETFQDLFELSPRWPNKEIARLV